MRFIYYLQVELLNYISLLQLRVSTTELAYLLLTLVTRPFVLNINLPSMIRV